MGYSGKRACQRRSDFASVSTAEQKPATWRRKSLPLGRCDQALGTGDRREVEAVETFGLWELRRLETGDDTAAIAKALGHPARIQIVRLLLQKQSCFGCDLVDEVKLAQSTVSEHLRIVKSAGIISGEIEHPRVCYSLDPGSVRPLAALLNAIFESDNRGELNGSICCPPSDRDSETSSA